MTTTMEEQNKAILKAVEENGDNILDALKEIPNPGVDQECEVLCRWAAARASVIVMTPVLGTVGLVANEIYLINRMAKLYNKKISEGAIISLVSACAATLAGNLLTTLIPVKSVKVGAAIGITYGIGKAGQAWLKAGMPSDLDPYVDMLEEWVKKGQEQVKLFTDDPLKNVPLGDETKDYLRTTGTRLKDAMEDASEKAAEKFAEGKERALANAEVAKEKAIEAKEVAVDSLYAAKDKAAESIAMTKEKAGETIAATKEKAAETFDATKEKAAETLAATKEKASETLETVKDKASDTLEAVKDKAAETLEVTKDKANERLALAKEKATDTLTATKDKAVVGAASALGDAAGKVSEVASSTQERLTQFVEQETKKNSSK